METGQKDTFHGSFLSGGGKAKGARLRESDTTIMNYHQYLKRSIIKFMNSSYGAATLVGRPGMATPTHCGLEQTRSKT